MISINGVQNSVDMLRINGDSKVFEAQSVDTVVAENDNIDQAVVSDLQTTGGVLGGESVSEIYMNLASNTEKVNINESLKVNLNTHKVYATSTKDALIGHPDMMLYTSALNVGVSSSIVESSVSSSASSSTSIATAVVGFEQLNENITSNVPLKFNFKIRAYSEDLYGDTDFTVRFSLNDIVIDEIELSTKDSHDNAHDITFSTYLSDISEV